jgi:hypothetical protein
MRKKDKAVVARTAGEPAQVLGLAARSLRPARFVAPMRHPFLGHLRDSDPEVICSNHVTRAIWSHSNSCPGIPERRRAARNLGKHRGCGGETHPSSGGELGHGRRTGGGLTGR